MKEENEISQTPRIVKSHDIRIDTDYVAWIAELKHRFRSAQVKASVRVNAEKLLFNWELGRDLVQKKAEERWGAGVVEQVSLDLQREFPNADGFSARNIWYMKRWYLFYNQADTKLYQAGKEIQGTKLHHAGGETENIKLYQAGREFPAPFALVPWRHYVEIISNFYVNAVDDLLKAAEEENPTIGLLICSDMNKADVQWSFRGISTPMGVATYNNVRIKDMLPTQEQLKERMELLQKEMRETKWLMRVNK